MSWIFGKSLKSEFYSRCHGYLEKSNFYKCVQDILNANFFFNHLRYLEIEFYKTQAA